MKHILYIMFLSILVSCNSRRETEEMIVADSAETTPAVETSNRVESIADDYAYLAKQKFQDYIDLLLLQTTHPEFDEATQASLLKIAPETLNITTSEEMTLQQFDPLGLEINMEIASTTILFGFEISTPKGNYKDTIVGDFKRSKIILDGIETASTKVTLHNYNE